ncbi:MAG: catabolite control protein A [Oscillospiraceae bacterium]|nr:catabolite control protein A [Oscillospiraceae bacterium]
MKRSSATALALALVLSLSACGTSSDVPPQSSSEGQNALQSTPSAEIEASETTSSAAEEEPKGKLGKFSETATIEETVLIDEDDIKITAKELVYTGGLAEVKLTIENNSDQDLSFLCATISYCCNSVNGYMAGEGYLNCEVAAGKKANDSISFNTDELLLHGITEISDIELGFFTRDEEYNYIYYPPCQIKTSAFEHYDYSENSYQEIITSNAAMNTFDYDMTYFSTDELYNENGVKLLSSGIMVNSDGEPALLVELENSNDSRIDMSIADIAINGLVVSSSTWSCKTINAGKRIIMEVDLSSALDSQYWDIYGIKEVGSVSFTLQQDNADGDEITEETPIEIAVPKTKAEFDRTGKEIYNSNELRIVYKTIVEDTSEYSLYMPVLLLAENIGEKTLNIEDIYDSLSVNGYMTDYVCYGKEIKSGESAVLEILIEESSLEDNDIGSASEINEVEIGFEIKSGSNTIDEPYVTISYE